MTKELSIGQQDLYKFICKKGETTMTEMSDFFCIRKSSLYERLRVIVSMKMVGVKVPKHPQPKIYYAKED